MLPLSNWNGSYSKLRTLKKKQGECLQLFLEWLQVHNLKNPTSIVEKVPPSEKWKLLKCNAQLLFLYSFILALVLCSMLTLYFQVNVETIFPFSLMVTTKSRPIPCDALLLRYLSWSTQMLLYSSLLPWWPSRLEIFFRCSQDVFCIYKFFTFEFIHHVYFRAWFRVTDSSIRTYQKNI